MRYILLALRYQSGKTAPKGFTMVQFLGAISILITFSFGYLNSANAEVWDLGYTNANPEVEEIPDTISGDAKADIVEVPASDADQEKPPIHSAPESHSITQISTQKNTFGVETVEKPGLKLFLSPVAGFTSILGNETVSITPEYAWGGRVGLLVSDNLMLEGGYTHSLMTSSIQVNLFPVSYVQSFDFKQNAFDAGAKVFFLGRESRFRPFIGGGLALANSTLNLMSSQLAVNAADDFKIKQFQGMGQLGAEFAITRGIVATAAFKVNGIFSSSVEAPKTNSGAATDAAKAVAGDSLSRSASYTGSVGVGVYF